MIRAEYMYQNGTSGIETALKMKDRVLKTEGRFVLSSFLGEARIFFYTWVGIFNQFLPPLLLSLLFLCAQSKQYFQICRSQFGHGTFYVLFCGWLNWWNKSLLGWCMLPTFFFFLVVSKYIINYRKLLRALLDQRSFTMFSSV